MSKVKVGVLFKSYEPLKAIQEYAKLTEESGFDQFWVAEAYHWFRQYGLEPRGVFTALAAATMATKDIDICLGITSPYMRHPTIQASECVGIDELSGGRFTMGIGVGKVGIEYLEYDTEQMKPVKVHHESLEIMRKVFSGDEFSYKGDLYESTMPAYDRAADGLRTDIPIFVGATGPFMQRLAGRESDGMLLAGLATPDFVRYARDNLNEGAEKAGRTLPADFPVGGVILTSCSRDGSKAKEATRSYVGTYIVNKLRNIKNDTILAGSGLPDEAWDPFRKAIEEGIQDDVAHLVTDEMQEKFTILSGTPNELVAVGKKLISSGLNMLMLEVVGASEADNLETIRLFGEEVLPRLQAGTVEEREAS